MSDPLPMEPGYYVVRRPSRGSGTRLHIESRPFVILSEEVWREEGIEADRYTPRRYAYDNAERWRDFVQFQHPKDYVFIIEVEPVQ